MPIAVRDRAESAAEGSLGYLAFRPAKGGQELRAALFIVNGLGEPLDFVFTRVQLPRSVLWRAADARRRATQALVKTLFTACPGRVDVVLARAAEIAPEVFSDDLVADVPCCRVSADVTHGPGRRETPDALPGGMHAFWAADPPDPNTAARRLMAALADRDLLIEPFERAGAGLDEALGA